MESTKVDLRGLEPGGAGWEKARDAVTASVVSYGFVVVQHGGLDRDMRQELFGRTMPELFAFPVETKRRNTNPDVEDYGGYLGPPGMDGFESLAIEDVTDAGVISDFANLFWPQGNPSFCEKTAVFATNAIQVLETVTEMVLEGLGARNKHALGLGSHQAVRYPFRMTYYGRSTSPDDDDEEAKTKVSMPGHLDDSITTIVVQHQVEGLEVQLKDGSWFPVPPEPDTCVIIAGNLFTVVTNNRVQACLHRVNKPTNRDRVSMLVGCVPRKGCKVQVMDELVDEAHPLMYHPCDPYKYFRFQHTEEGRKSKDALKTFCGVLQNEPVEAEA